MTRAIDYNLATRRKVRTREACVSLQSNVVKTLYKYERNLSAHAQYIWAIPCRTAEQCASVLGLSQNYRCSEGYCLCANFTSHAYELCSNKDMILRAKASGLRRNCTTHEDCDLINGSKCLPKESNESDKICLCQPEMVESQDGQSCLSIVRKIDGSCSEHIQCVSGLKQGAECMDGHCRCRSTHHYGGKDCMRNLGFGELCKPEEDECYLEASSKGKNILFCNKDNKHCEFTSAASSIVGQFVTISLLILIIAFF